MNIKGVLNYAKGYRKSTDILLLLFFIINIIVLGGIIFSSFNNDFVVDVIERKEKLGELKGADYEVGAREIHGQLKFESDKFLDFVFVNKMADLNLSLFLFTVFVLFQLMRIKALWYHQYFTKKLYVSIDSLGYVASIMFFFSRVQEYYLHKVVSRISHGALIVDVDSSLLIITVVIILLSSVLKSLAKQGNIIQEEQNLTI